MSTNKFVHAMVVAGICAGLMGASGAEAATTRAVTLNWAPNAQPVTGYEIHYGKTAAPMHMRLLANPTNLNLAAPSVQFNVLRDLAALPGQEVCFRVKAYSNTGKSAFSEAVCTII